MGTFLIILLLIFTLFPLVKKWIAIFMRHRAEDYLRKTMNMPPRPGSREDRKRQRRQKENPTPRSKRRENTQGEPLIPKEYAEDVEYVEMRDYSETTVVEGSVGTGGKKEKKEKIRIESQVTDVEWTEVKITTDSDNNRK